MFLHACCAEINKQNCKERDCHPVCDTTLAMPAWSYLISHLKVPFVCKCTTVVVSGTRQLTIKWPSIILWFVLVILWTDTKTSVCLHCSSLAVLYKQRKMCIHITVVFRCIIFLAVHPKVLNKTSSSDTIISLALPMKLYCPCDQCGKWVARTIRFLPSGKEMLPDGTPLGGVIVWNSKRLLRRKQLGVNIADITRVEHNGRVGARH